MQKKNCENRTVPRDLGNKHVVEKNVRAYEPIYILQI